jgi:glycosyltransferase involved in cell wall biosynthesis
VVPVAYPIPDQPLDPVEDPNVALYADWSWRPNKMALDRLLRVWPEVNVAVPGSRLILAGPHLDRASVGTMPGVTTIGAVRASAEVLSQAAIVAFPCPPTSGPKVKVLEALSYGVPVVTTDAGVEGLMIGPDEGAVVADLRNFSAVMISLLASPERRVALGTSGRSSAIRHHGPQPVARARLAAFESAFGVGAFDPR